MPLSLLRLPFLAAKEIIKSMNVQDIFEMSWLSKKCHNLVKTSIPKDSLQVELRHYSKNDLSIIMFPKSRSSAIWKIDEFKAICDGAFKATFSICGHGVCCKQVLTGDTNQDEEFTRKFFTYFTTTFHPSIVFIFYDYIRDKFAMELVKECRQNKIRLDRIICSQKEVNSELIREILEGSTEGEYLNIDTELPNDFKYTQPSGGFKFSNFYAANGDWINLEDFGQCEYVQFSSDSPNVSPQNMNNFFKKVISMEYSIGGLRIDSSQYEMKEFPKIVDGLNESPIFKDRLGKSKKIEKMDGQEMKINLYEKKLEMSLMQ